MTKAKPVSKVRSSQNQIRETRNYPILGQQCPRTTALPAAGEWNTLLDHATFKLRGDRPSIPWERGKPPPDLADCLTLRPTLGVGYRLYPSGAHSPCPTPSRPSATSSPPPSAPPLAEWQRHRHPRPRPPPCRRLRLRLSRAPLGCVRESPRRRRWRDGFGLRRGCGSGEPAVRGHPV